MAAARELVAPAKVSVGTVLRGICELLGQLVAPGSSVLELAFEVHHGAAGALEMRNCAIGARKKVNVFRAEVGDAPLHGLKLTLVVLDLFAEELACGGHVGAAMASLTLDENVQDGLDDLLGQRGRGAAICDREEIGAFSFQADVVREAGGHGVALGGDYGPRGRGPSC